jgi:AAA15 family ATPase/GTPase
MATYLQLGKYKKIRSELTILNFDSVNYFVGPNGTGKSSILATQII